VIGSFCGGVDVDLYPLDLAGEPIAARDGEHSVVVWKRLYLTPSAAKCSAVGVRQGSPNTLDAPKPTSSSSTKRTFRAPAGGRNCVIGGNLVPGSFALWVVRPMDLLSGIGSISRSGELFVGMALPKKSGPNETFDVKTQETPRKHRRSSREFLRLEASSVGCSTVKNDRLKGDSRNLVIRGWNKRCSRIDWSRLPDSF
jgi:hypothetical protein